MIMSWVAVILIASQEFQFPNAGPVQCNVLLVTTTHAAEAEA
jgi:hypothetical protein